MDSETNNHKQEPCEECAIVPASCQCVKCECHLCDNCFDTVHKQFKYTRSHVKEPLTKVPSRSTEMCGAHSDRSVEYYCEDDCCAVCDHCVIVGTHRGHQIITIEQQTDKVRAVVAKAQLLLSSCQQSVQVLDEMCQQVISNKTTSVLAIEAHFHQIFEEITASLNQRKKILIDQTTREYDHHLTDLQQRLHQVSQKQEYLKQYTNGDLKMLLSGAEDFYECIPLVKANEQPAVIRCHLDSESLLDVINKYGQVNLPANANESVEVVDRSISLSRSQPNTELPTTSPQHHVTYSSRNASNIGDTAKVNVMQYSRPVNNSAMSSQSGQHSVNGTALQEFSKSSSLCHVPGKVNTAVGDGSVRLNVDSRDSMRESSRVNKIDVSIAHIEHNDTQLVPLVAHVSKHIPEGLPSSEDLKKWSAQPVSGSIKSKISPSEDLERRPVLSSNVSDKMRAVTMKNQRSATDFQGSRQLTGSQASYSSGGSPLSSSPAGSRANSIKSTSSDHVGSTSWEHVYLANIRSPGHFYVQYERDIPKLKMLMDEINELCAHQTKTAPVEHVYAEGSPVLAKFSDKQWCRAEVLRTVDHQVEVRFIDYGNMEKVSYDSIQEIPSNFNFFKCPKLSSLCALDGLCFLDGKSSDWPEDAITAFALMTNNKRMLMKLELLSNIIAFITLKKPVQQIVRQTDELMFVELAWLPETEDVIPESRLEFVSDALVFLNVAMRSNLVDRNKQQSEYCCSELPQKGQHISVNISFLVEPDRFVVQLLQNAVSGVRQPHLRLLMSDLQSTHNDTLSSNKYILRVPAIGMPVAAKFSVDGLWYRAKIIDLMPPGHIKVLYVDFGNDEVLPIAKIHKLAPRFLSLPIQALYCKLNTESSSSFRLITRAFESNTIVVLTVNDILPGPLLDVSLQVSATPKSSPKNEIAKPAAATKKPVVTSGLTARPSEVTPTKPLWESKLFSPPKPVRTDQVPRSATPAKVEQPSRSATPVRPDKVRNIDVVSEATYKPVYISHVVSPAEIYIQVSSPADKAELEKLMLELNRQYDGTKCKPDSVWRAGMNCVVHRYQDSTWYRGEIDEIGQENDLVKVYMGDYGYREWVDKTDLRSIDGCPKRAWFSAQCHLTNIVPSSIDGSWTQLACEVIYERVCGQTVYMDVKETVGVNSIPIDLFHRELVRGSALTPDRFVYSSVAAFLVENKLARFLSVNSASESGISVSPTRTSALESDALGLSPRSVNNTSTDFLPPKPHMGNSMMGAVTHVNSEGFIYVQELSSDLSSFQDIIHRVQKHYANTKPEPTVIWKVGCPVAAFFDADSTFYRAKIMGFDDQGIKVLFVDFGNIEIVQKNRLRLLEDQFMTDPIACYACRLNNLIPADKKAWEENFSNVVTDLTESKRCSIEIKTKDEDGTLYVDIMLPEGESISNTLCRDGIAVFASNDYWMYDQPGSPKRASSYLRAVSPCIVLPSVGGQAIPERVVASPYLSRLMPSIGDHMYVTVTQVDSPSVVFLQHLPCVDTSDLNQMTINEELKQLEKLALLYENVGEFQPLGKSKVCPGAACLALYSDNRWYRAEIIEIVYAAGINGDDVIAVRFVDYGSFEFLDYTRLRELPLEHLSCLAMQAVSCTLAGIRLPKDKQLFDNAVIELTTLFAGRKLLAVVKGISYYDSEITADLFDMDEYRRCSDDPPLVYKALIEAGIIEHSLFLSTNSLVDVCAAEDDDD